MGQDRLLRRVGNPPKSATEPTPHASSTSAPQQVCLHQAPRRGSLPENSKSSASSPLATPTKKLRSSFPSPTTQSRATAKIFATNMASIQQPNRFDLPEQ